MLNLLKLLLKREIPIRIAEKFGRYMVVGIEERFSKDGETITIQLEDFAKYSERNKEHYA